MTTIKQKVLRLLLIAEVFVVSGFYYFGANGLQAIFRMQEKNYALANDSVDARLRVQRLRELVKEWDEDPFYTEQHAREKLAMARDEETIYLID